MSSSDDGCWPIIKWAIILFLGWVILQTVIDEWESILWFLKMWGLTLLLGVALIIGAIWYIKRGHAIYLKWSEKRQDIDLTNKFKKAGEILDIQVLDHLILSPDGGYYAFSEHSKI